MSKSLAEVKHAVFEFFQQEATLVPTTQSDLIKFDCDDKDVKQGLVTEALRDLEKYEITRAFKVGNKDGWVLTKPLPTFERQIAFGYDTLSSVADVLNRYAAIHDNQKVITDASAIRESDIQRLALIASALLPTPDKSS
jgi:hypothetical protein